MSEKVEARLRNIWFEFSTVLLRVVHTPQEPRTLFRSKFSQLVLDTSSEHNFFSHKVSENYSMIGQKCEADVVNADWPTS